MSDPVNYLPMYTLASRHPVGDLSPVRSVLSSPAALVAGSGSPLLSSAAPGTSEPLTAVQGVPFSGTVYALASGPSGAVAAACADGNIYVLPALAGGAEASDYVTLRGHSSRVTSLNWDGPRLLSGSWDGTARVWDVESRAELQQLGGHDNGVSVAYDVASDAVVTVASGRSAGGGAFAGCDLKIWRRASPADAYKVAATASPHRQPIRAVAVCALGVVTCSNDSSVALSDLTTGNLISQTPCPDAQAPFLLALCTVASPVRLGDCAADSMYQVSGERSGRGGKEEGFDDDI
jgi:phospholipase A-2-activating protein